MYNKPLSISIEETKQNIVDIINDSKLHPSILEMIIKDIYWDINKIKINTIIKEQEQFTKESTSQK